MVRYFHDDSQNIHHVCLSFSVSLGNPPAHQRSSTLDKPLPKCCVTLTHLVSCSRCEWWGRSWGSAGTPTEPPDWRPCASRRLCLSSAWRRTSKCEPQAATRRTTRPHSHRKKNPNKTLKTRLQMKTLPVLKPHSKLWQGLPHLFSQNYWESPPPPSDFSLPPRLPPILVSPPCSLRTSFSMGHNTTALPLLISSHSTFLFFLFISHGRNSYYCTVTGIFICFCFRLILFTSEILPWRTNLVHKSQACCGF